MLNSSVTILALFLLALSLQVFISVAQDGPIVHTPNGKVVGLVSQYNGNRYEEYLGIPFAEPPIGPLRWQKPEPVKPWEGVLNATEFAPHCTQLVSYGYPVVGISARNGEDCLYVNVWVPNGVDANQGRQLPVMVFYYGGGFLFGTSEMYPGYALALHGDLIVVGFNYRVNALGFLSTGDQESPGNYGLWDQQAALLWVRENIASFNGDPSRVTIFGQSAGAASVSHNVISHHTNQLFQNAIAISGGATTRFGATTRGIDMAIALAELADCPTQNTRVIMNCLREKNAHLLSFWGVVMYFLNVTLETGRISQWKPVVDRDFVRRSPHESFEIGVGKHINFITGTAYDDGAGFVLLNPLATPILGDNYNRVKDNATMWESAMGLLGWAANREQLFNEILKYYPDMNLDDELKRTMAATRAFTDGTFGAPSNFEAVRHARDSVGEEGRTYQYLFKYRQSFLRGYPSWVQGSHLDDIYSVLGDPFMEFYRITILRRPYSAADRQMSSKIMNYYSNFAHTGNPNEGPFEVEVEWNEFDPFNQKYLLETAPNFRMSDFYEDNTIDLYRFWQDVYPNMIVPVPPPTFSPETADSNSAPKRQFTEEEIQEAVDKVKFLLKSIITDDIVWKELERTIDGYVEERKH